MQCARHRLLHGVLGDVAIADDKGDRADGAPVLVRHEVPHCRVVEGVRHRGRSLVGVDRLTRSRKLRWIRSEILARTGVRNYSPVIPRRPDTVTPPS